MPEIANPAANVDARDPVVVLAADENFAMPLAATVRSAIDNLAPERKLRLFILDGGICADIKTKLEQSWPAGRFDVSWVDVDAGALADAPVSGHVSQVAYYRILMPRLLPEGLDRVIYLDSDLVVCADLTRLWESDFEGAPCLAVQDCAAPFVDASQALANFNRCGPHLGSSTPIENYRELGLDPLAPYFNSGILLVDLQAWRNEDLSGQLLACLEQNSAHVLWWDQYALNVVLSGRWKPLDPRWNQGAHAFAFNTWSQSPYDATVYRQVRDEPYIIHFTTHNKPWMVSCLHPLRKQFYRYVDRTAWAGWRPAWFNRPQTFFKLLKTQQRRLRFARRRAQHRFVEWLYQPRPSDASAGP
ncbi:MAG: glycosyltransferase family 8 protein [Planctomycetales bacterium]|nr:glycosyltransferase family 8 protein [Planctomycetales bacterium]